MSDEEKNSVSEFYYLGKLEFQVNSHLTETYNKRVGERESKGNSQEEAVDIFLYLLTLAFDSRRCGINFSCSNMTITFYMTFSQL